jgi:hypothetical protein
VYKISRSWVDVLIFYVLLFRVVMRFRDGSDKGAASSVVQTSEEALWICWQLLDFPKLKDPNFDAVDQMTAQVPEIMNGLLYVV